MRDSSAVLRLCSQLAGGEIPRHEFLQGIVRQMAQGIGCARTAVRMLVDSPEGLVLRSAAMYDARRRALVDAADISGRGLLGYLGALERDGCIVANEARLHPITAWLLESYLLPAGAHGLLDVGLSINGVLCGVFSCEHTDARARWDAHQVQQLRQLSSRVGLALMSAARDQWDDALHASWQSPTTGGQLVTMPMPLDPPKATAGSPRER